MYFRPASFEMAHSKRPQRFLKPLRSEVRLNLTFIIRLLFMGEIEIGSPQTDHW